MTDDFDFDFSFDDAKPRTWGDAFPWVAGAAGVAIPAWWSHPLEETDFGGRRRYLNQISELAMERLPHWTVGQIFPGLSPELDLTSLQLPVRAMNALARHYCSTAADMMPMTVDSILDWRQVGVGTVDAILQALADASTSTSTPAITSQAYTPPTGEPLPFDDLRMPGWMSSMVDDLNTMATWYSTVGLPSQSLLGGSVPPGTPEEVLKARERLQALTASDILTENEFELDVAALFDDALGLLDPRAVTVLAERLFADEPLTLDQLGEMHGVTRERIRQIEGKARGAMLSAISDDGPMAAVAASARALVGTIRPLEDLLELIPALGRTVERIGQPAWRVLDRLDDAYEIEDGWCVVPTLSAARDWTKTQLLERANPFGVGRLEDLELVETSHPDARVELTKKWLVSSGYLVHGPHVLMRTQSVGDYAATILSIHGEPMSLQQIVDQFAYERSPGSVRNAMAIDERFERVDRDRWALSEWGMDVYANIRSVIRREVGQSGGAIDIDTLVERITSTYSVTANSVIAYASSAPFELRGGVVRPADMSREARKPPERTARLYRRGDGWVYRVRITHDHLRGSGSVAPVAITSVLGMEYGDKIQLKSGLGDQSISWVGTQPQFGTIRRYLLEYDVAGDTEVFLVMGDDRTFDVEVIPEPSANALSDALTLVGASPALNVDAARRALATAICLPEESPVVSIIGGYRDRGDSDIADLLTTARHELETGEPGAPTVRSAEVDDILDLL